MIQDNVSNCLTMSVLSYEEGFFKVLSLRGGGSGEMQGEKGRKDKVVDGVKRERVIKE